MRQMFNPTSFYGKMARAYSTGAAKMKEASDTFKASDL
jgi:hypothetical protein